MANVALAAVVLALISILVETGLRWRERSSEAQLEDDDALVRRMAPYAAGHDARGFRNAVAVPRACVVAIGDSQTWGVNVTIEESWPSQFERQTGLGTYNMSLGGYGLAQYSVLATEALALRPKVVVMAVYVGNDIWETYRCVYSRERWAALRAADSSLLSVREDPVERAAQDYWSSKGAFLDTCFRWPPGLWPNWLRAHTAIGRLVDRAGAGRWTSAWEAASRAWARATPDQAEVWDGPGAATVFTPRFRFQAVDQREPRIREGLRLSSALIEAAADTVGRGGAILVVLLIPTKESVYAAAYPGATSKLQGAFVELVRAERAASQRLSAGASSRGLLIVDALGPLATAVAQGVRVYPANEDGHPVAAGYAVLASTVRGALSGRIARPCTSASP